MDADGDGVNDAYADRDGDGVNDRDGRHYGDGFPMHDPIDGRDPGGHGHGGGMGGNMGP